MSGLFFLYVAGHFHMDSEWMFKYQGSFEEKKKEMYRVQSKSYYSN